MVDNVKYNVAFWHVRVRIVAVETKMHYVYIVEQHLPVNVKILSDAQQ
jgi:hypothetical protein